MALSKNRARQPATDAPVSLKPRCKTCGFASWARHNGVWYCDFCLENISRANPGTQVPNGK